MKFFVGLLFSIIIAVVTAAPSEKSSQQRETRQAPPIPGQEVAETAMQPVLAGAQMAQGAAQMAQEAGQSIPSNLPPPPGRR